MSQIMKAFTGIFFILMMTMSSMGLLGGFLQVVRVQNIHSAIIDELENSDFAKAILEDCFRVASEEEYELTIALYDEKKGVVVCNEAASIPDNCDGVRMAEITLQYPLHLNFFGIEISQKLFGYAR